MSLKMGYGPKTGDAPVDSTGEQSYRQIEHDARRQEENLSPRDVFVRYRGPPVQEKNGHPDDQDAI